MGRGSREKREEGGGLLSLCSQRLGGVTLQRGRRGQVSKWLRGLEHVAPL